MSERKIWVLVDSHIQTDEVMPPIDWRSQNSLSEDPVWRYGYDSSSMSRAGKVAAVGKR
jgi:hypothetical protein